jgi:hypothetical protein
VRFDIAFTPLLQARGAPRCSLSWVSNYPQKIRSNGTDFVTTPCHVTKDGHLPRHAVYPRSRRNNAADESAQQMIRLALLVH